MLETVRKTNDHGWMVKVVVLVSSICIKTFVCGKAKDKKIKSKRKQALQILQ